MIAIRCSGYQQNVHFEFKLVPCAGDGFCDKKTRLCTLDVDRSKRCPSDYHVCPDGTHVPYSYPDCKEPTCPPACGGLGLCEQVCFINFICLILLYRALAKKF